MSSCVYYKFKSRKESKKISFDGPSISVKDLRERILLHSDMKANDMILKIHKPKDTSAPKDAKLEEYKDDESVKKFSTVIVSRMPCPKREVTRPKIANPEILSRKDPYKTMSKDDGKDMKFHEMQKNAKLYELDLSEEDKIALMMKQSTEGYFLDKNPRKRGQPPGPPPPHYVCHKCKMGGHYVDQCPGIKDKEGNPVDLKNLKRPTGIPQDFLVEVSKDTPGAYLTKDGRYTLPIKDRDAFVKGKKEKRPFSEEENPAYVPEERKPVDMIVCPLCQQVMREAVFISCCGYTYCQECLTDYIFNTDVKGCGRCPNCNSVVESAESFTENPTVRELVRKYNAGVTNLFTNTSKNVFQLKNEPGTVASASTSTAPTKTAPSTKAPSDAPTTTTTTATDGATSSAPSSQSPVHEDESNVKPKETSAIRGPFVDGRRVLKPKPPPEVVMTRRSDTLKTEANPSVPSGTSEKPKTESSLSNAPEFELDLGLDDTTDSFLNENLKAENAVKKEPTEESSEIPSTSAAETSGPADEETSSQLSADKESVGGETISVHTFDNRFGRSERSSAARNPASGSSKKDPVPVSVTKPIASIPVTVPAKTTADAAASLTTNPIVTTVPVTHAGHGSLLRNSAGLVVSQFGPFRVVPGPAQAPAQNLHPRSHLPQSVLMGSQFPQNHFYQVYNSACLYDLAQSQQGALAGAPLAGALINGVVPTPLPIPNTDIMDAPILSEDQFNTLRRNFLADEAKRHRRRHRSRGYSRSRSRDRHSLSRSPSSRRRRGYSRDRSSRRRMPQYPEGRHRRSPRSRRHESPRLHSRDPRSRRGSGSNRDSVSPAPYGGSASSGHKISPYRSDNRAYEHTSSHSDHRKRQRTDSEPRQETRAPLEMFEKRVSPGLRPHRRGLSPSFGQTSSRHHVLKETEVRKMLTDGCKSWNPTGHVTDVEKTSKPSKILSCHSSSSSHTSVTVEAPVSKRKRRPSLDGCNTIPQPSLKQSHSQGSLPAYRSESMRQLKHEYRSKNSDRDSRHATTHRLAEEEPRQTVHCALNNATRVDEKSERAKLSMSPEHHAWYSKTSSFLEKLGIQEQPKAQEELPESKRNKPKKVHDRKRRKSPESVKCVPLMDIVVENPNTPVNEPPAVVAKEREPKPKKDGKIKKIAPPKSSEPSSTRYPSDLDSDLPPETVAEPPRKKDRKVIEEVKPIPEVTHEVKKKSKKEKKEKKEKKKKKKKRKDEKDGNPIEAPVEVELLAPVEMQSEGRLSDHERSNCDNNSASALIPPPSKWELELDDHVNEFEEESRQERARSVTRIPSLISSVNYRRVSVEGDDEVEAKKSHKTKKEAKRHKKKKRERR